MALTTAARLKVVSALDRKHVPFARDAFKGFAATVAKAQAGTCYQILNGTRDEDFTSASERRHARTDMDRNAADIIAHHFTLAGMEAGADFDP